jgi:hypothetical protein
MKKSPKEPGHMRPYAAKSGQIRPPKTRRRARLRAASRNLTPSQHRQIGDRTCQAEIKDGNAPVAAHHPIRALDVAVDDAFLARFRALTPIAPTPIAPKPVCAPVERFTRDVATAGR